MCEGLLSALLDRLGNRSMRVKMKAMRCIKHLVKQGNPHFRALLQGRAEQLRPCVAISGAPDPRFGDSLYAAIRADATEVLDLLYRPTAVRQQHALSALSSTSVAPGPAYPAHTAPPESAGASFQARFQREGGGGGALTNFGAVPGGQAAYTRSQPDERPPVQPTAAQSSLARGLFGSAPGGGSSDSLSRLLDASRGSSVPAGELQAYTQQLRTEGAGAVAEALRVLAGAARSATGPAAQMRVLCVVQAVCECGAVDASAQEHVAALRGTLDAWRSSSVFAVRTKAHSVVALLGNIASSAPASAPASASAPLADLLGLSGAPEPVLAPAQPQQQPADPLAGLLFGSSAPQTQSQPQPQQSSSSGFDALLGIGTQPAQPAQPAQSSFDFLSTPAPAPAQAPATDLFSGLSTSDDHSTPSSSFDFVSGAAPAPAPAPAPATSSAFDFLSAAPEPAPAPAPSSTAFDFIQSDPAPAQAAPSAFSFTAAPAASASGSLLDL